MFKSLLKIVLAIACVVSFVSAEWVSGYMKKDGTYVPGYYRNRTTSTYSVPKSKHNDGFGEISTYTNKPRIKTYVSGYFKDDGTWVSGYWKSE